MTGQVSDVIKYKGESYTIVGFSSDLILPSPTTFGMEAYSTNTACWRGFQLAFLVEDSLILDGVWINTKEPKEINGQKAEPCPSFFEYFYENLNYLCRTSGKIKIAKDFIQEMYVHMGFQEAIAFKTVFELTFEEGKLTKVSDFSQYYAERREKGDHFQEPLNPMEHESVKEWVNERFNLKDKE